MEYDYSPEWRCHACRNIPWDYEDWFQIPQVPTVIPHHDSFADLDDSAAEGCHLCRVLRSLVYYEIDRRHLKEPPAGSCTIQLPKDSYLDPTILDPAPNFFDDPRAATFKIGTAPFHVQIVINNSRAGEEVVPVTPSPLDKSLESRLRETFPACIDDCIDKRGIHQECDAEWFKQDVNSRSPTRLIEVDVGDSNKARIVVPEEDLPKDYRPKYLTLSYCWGITNESATTTRATIASRRQGFNIDTLPKTIRDAIQLTRILGFRYLWVDAICIIQSHAIDEYFDDWNMETSRIGSYYLHSECLISAWGASDSSEGLFMEPKAQKYPLKTCALAYNRHGQEYLSVSLPTPNFARDWCCRPLRERGWCLQEAALSPRAIHWSRYTFSWQCHGRMEWFTQARPFEKPKELDQVYRLELSPTHPELSIEDSWTTLLGMYTRMEFTYESDRLVAIQGLVDRLIDMHGDEYFAGVFRSHLAKGLLWENAYNKTEKALGEVPTWSWASNCPGVWFHNPSHSLITYSKETVFPKGWDPLNLDTPEKRALRFQAPWINVELERTFTAADIVPSYRDWRPLKFDCFASFGNEKKQRLEMFFKYDAESLVPESFSEVMVVFVALHILGRGEVAKVKEPDESIVVRSDIFTSFHGILVRPEGRFYERVGVVQFDVPKDYQSWLELKQEMDQSRKEVCLI
ncbi:hypothetical protein FSARC_5159 [Fusarium sarcochroum]|uniref:Heterokaryon incompatibility domain-containing protein n=1 Tax=Fusarium sarcochroum TaxID=1208366 RepID=A0A8H4X9T3_9HYPO|nr:hypothetical protein FSARC_5159 [Fusarium sarcochroum]